MSGSNAKSPISRSPNMVGWWGASIIIHVTALAGLYFIKPELINSSDTSQTTSGSEQYQEVIAEAQSAQAQTLASKLEEMELAGEKLKAASDAKLQQYADSVKDQNEPVPDPASARQAIERAQAEAALFQKQLAEKPDSQSLQNIEQAQTRALVAQDEVMRSLERSAALNKDDLIKQDRARQAQLEAQAAQNAASKLLRDASGESAEGKKAIDEARKAQEDITEAENSLKNAQNNLTRLQGELAKAHAATQPSTPMDEKAAKKAQQNLQKATDRVTKGNADVAKAQANVVTRKQKLGAAASAGGGAMSSKAIKAQADASAVQLRANQQQSAVNSSAGIGKSDSAALDNPPKTLSQVYDSARSKESELIDRYREIRAADLAMLRGISLSEALKLLDVPRPNRLDFDRELLDGQSASPDELAAALKAVSSEIDSMASTARRLADESQSRTASGNLNSKWVRQQTETTARNDQLALQEAGLVAKDLTAAMGGGSGTGTGNPGTGSGGTGARGSGNGIGTSGSGSGGGPGSGGGNPSSGNGSGGSKLPGELGQSLRQEATRDLRPIPGRRVGSGVASIEPNRRGQWMFIDSWHMIGPWPNPSRSEINTRFPPETIVDLDASYITRANQRVTWNYYQAAKEMVSPPGMDEYEIFYGYSELWFDTPQDLWVAIGSDDQSMVWIEDHLIWKSSSAHKDWNAIEGFRKVHFKQGRNRVLVRLENGHGKGGFSFIVNLDPKFGPDSTN